MKILVVDGQGGGVGRQLAVQIKQAFPDSQLMAVGTNTVATSAMMKGGADTAATGGGTGAGPGEPAAGNGGEPACLL